MLDTKTALQYYKHLATKPEFPELSLAQRHYEEMIDYLQRVQQLEKCFVVLHSYIMASSGLIKTWLRSWDADEHPVNDLDRLGELEVL